MHDKLRGYYEQEMAKLKNQFATFSNEYPRVAARLSFTSGQTGDPHVQRMMQAFALIAAEIRVNRRRRRAEIHRSVASCLAPALPAAVPGMLDRSPRSGQGFTEQAGRLAAWHGTHVARRGGSLSDRL
ncbi:hypothetical protein DIE14_00775 [Burkholderia sp. Bp9017]|uniref:Type VI secretion system baseplate subunit TssF n=1 Tax=Burkholderia anthina TaxID=179879 RepID=A0A7T6VJB1_9BURK|nr:MULTISPECIES: type VI secretion system baseplate subunit TssF [Burkholderia]MBY4864923.1 type VI secretion system baseplate subunit TssF [Burkholderia anthina]QQK04904.1 type VI secretion system baseplate subunit TssF [Burkholderia anthina]RQZ31487.1 hypothetical protein DIE14_00775 [Burkholderia sp. Bp9017]RQZ37620.1 hypothetical protein DIE13_00765 [Burkholderia sp. Bp9016]